MRGPPHATPIPAPGGSEGALLGPASRASPLSSHAKASAIALPPLRVVVDCTQPQATRRPAPRDGQCARLNQAGPPPLFPHSLSRQDATLPVCSRCVCGGRCGAGRNNEHATQTGLLVHHNPSINPFETRAAAVVCLSCCGVGGGCGVVVRGHNNPGCLRSSSHPPLPRHQRRNNPKRRTPRAAADPA